MPTITRPEPIGLGSIGGIIGRDNMGTTEIITLEYSQKQGMFHFRFQNENCGTKEWATIGKINLDKAILFCEFKWNKYYEEKSSIAFIRMQLKDYLLKLKVCIIYQ